MAFGAGLLFTVTACPAYGTPDDIYPDGGPVPPPMDAGLDAGAGDAGAPPVEPMDAGELDAGELDAGELDAGESDAGESDAG